MDESAEVKKTDSTEADGYYEELDTSLDDLDLSFLDEEDKDEE